MRWLIAMYRRYVSPFTAPRCRFEPTCAEYADMAITQFGAGRGSWLALKRICRCQPLATPGYDPVPPDFRWWGKPAEPAPANSPGQPDAAAGRETPDN